MAGHVHVHPWCRLCSASKTWPPKVVVATVALSVSSAGQKIGRTNAACQRNKSHAPDQESQNMPTNQGPRKPGNRTAFLAPTTDTEKRQTIVSTDTIAAGAPTSLHAAAPAIFQKYTDFAAADRSNTSKPPNTRRPPKSKVFTLPSVRNGMYTPTSVRSLASAAAACAAKLVAAATISSITAADTQHAWKDRNFRTKRLGQVSCDGTNWNSPTERLQPSGTTKAFCGEWRRSPNWWYASSDRTNWNIPTEKMSPAGDISDQHTRVLTKQIGRSVGLEQVADNDTTQAAEYPEGGGGGSAHGVGRVSLHTRQCACNELPAPSSPRQPTVVGHRGLPQNTPSQLMNTLSMSCHPQAEQFVGTGPCTTLLQNSGEPYAAKTSEKPSPLLARPSIETVRKLNAVQPTRRCTQIPVELVGAVP